MNCGIDPIPGAIANIWISEIGVVRQKSQFKYNQETQPPINSRNMRLILQRGNVKHQSFVNASEAGYDAPMPRTTLSIDDDAFNAAREYARRRGQTLGQAISELVLRATTNELETDDIKGFHVVRLRADSPKVTAAKVKNLGESV